jgi:hypothetical protein
MSKHGQAAVAARPVYPPLKDIRLVGVTPSNFASGDAMVVSELSRLADSRLTA